MTTAEDNKQLTRRLFEEVVGLPLLAGHLD